MNVALNAYVSGKLTLLQEKKRLLFLIRNLSDVSSRSDCWFNHISKLATRGNGLNLSTAVVVLGFPISRRLLVTTLGQRGELLRAVKGICTLPRQVPLGRPGPRPRRSHTASGIIWPSLAWVGQQGNTALVSRSEEDRRETAFKKPTHELCFKRRRPQWDPQMRKPSFRVPMAAANRFNVQFVSCVPPSLCRHDLLLPFTSFVF